MATLKDDILTFQGLGLTKNEAKILYALFNFETSSVQTLAEFSKIPRPKIYTIMSQLQEKGLVTSTISRPIKFSAIPLEDCIKIMVEKKDREHDILNRKAKDLLQKIKNQTTSLDDNKSDFKLIPSNEYNIRVRKIATNQLQASLDVITTWKRYNETMNKIGEELKNAVKRGVNCRFIIDVPKNKSEILLPISASFGNNLFKIRFLLDTPDTLLSVNDKKEIFFALFPKESLTDSPLLWSNNIHLTKIFQDYFNILWLTAIETLEETNYRFLNE